MRRHAVSNINQRPGSSDVFTFQVGYVWDFNHGTTNGWTILGSHALPGNTFTRETGDGRYQLELITVDHGEDFSGNVMSKDIFVEAGKTYDFSFILSRITSFGLLNPAQLALTVNGVPVSDYYTVEDTPLKVEGTLKATATGTITLAIHDLVALGTGNDFWIDNVESRIRCHHFDSGFFYPKKSPRCALRNPQ